MSQFDNRSEVIGFVKAKINWTDAECEPNHCYEGIRMDKTHSQIIRNKNIDRVNRELLDRFHPIFENYELDCWKGSVWWKDEETEYDKQPDNHSGETTLDILVDKICKIENIKR